VYRRAVSLAPGVPATSFDVIRSRAPLRISFCGGGTDVPPYPERFGGCVLSCAIDKYAFVSLRSREDESIRVHSSDLNRVAEFRGQSPLDGTIDLAQTIFHRFGTHSLDCYMSSDAPPGSGLGSSSAMIVALIAALARREARHLSDYEMADLAYVVERTDLNIQGGMQDQYAATFGGFNFIEFTSEGVLVNPLRISEDALNELHCHLLLCYTGVTRVSSSILREQTDNVVAAVPDVMESLAELKALTLELKRSLLQNRFVEFGEILDRAWHLKKRLASGISSPSIDEFYNIAKRAGAIGGKLLGAGGGGFLLIFAPFTRRDKIRERLELAGGKVVDFQFDQRGVRTWLATGDTWIEQPAAQ
jgi:D-glycero-alpha-D-manno-heptose-7-phosphate kinase